MNAHICMIRASLMILYLRASVVNTKCNHGIYDEFIPSWEWERERKKKQVLEMVQFVKNISFIKLCDWQFFPCMSIIIRVHSKLRSCRSGGLKIVILFGIFRLNDIFAG